MYRGKILQKDKSTKTQLVTQKTHFIL